MIAIAWLALCLPTAHAQPAHDPAENRHLLLLLPDRLVHLEVRVSDGGESLAAKREKYIQQLLARLDSNQDGQLSSAETGKHPLFVQGRRFDGNKFLESLKSRRPITSSKTQGASRGLSDVEAAVERAAGKLMTYRQNSLVSDQDSAVFRILDENVSGTIDRIEMRTATVRVAARDKDFDQCITRDEFLDTSNDMSGGVLSATSEPPESVHSDMLREGSEPIVAQLVMRKYDTNRNNQLSATEIGWASERLQNLDTNRNAEIDAQELAKITGDPPDLILAIDLDKQKLALQMLGGSMAQSMEAKSERALASKLTAWPVNFQIVDRDVIAEAMQNSQLAFNTIDVDNNGYLDRKEIAEHQRFERYLFDAMDANDDDRVFASEMQAYVKEYTEPALTSCQVTIFNMGFGVFQILDQNMDGRISVRELRRTEASLLKHSPNQQTIESGQLGSSYRIEFQRGGVGLFGRVDRPQAQATPTVIASQSGPIWFQRMDRNGDGDLIWDEFLGPRDVFHQLDSDGDGLVDIQEATTFEQKLSSK